jgi:hypothetical protein
LSNFGHHTPASQPLLLRTCHAGLGNQSRTAVDWRARVVPIASFLNGAKFDRETTRVMGVAFEMTRVALGIAERRDELNEMVAKRIMELAKQGERNPDLLCERTLTNFRAQYL